MGGERDGKRNEGRRPRWLARTKPGLLRQFRVIAGEMTSTEGLEPSVFRSVHSKEYGCELVAEKFSWRNSDWQKDGQPRPSVVIYKLRCRLHDVQSAPFEITEIGEATGAEKRAWTTN